MLIFGLTILIASTYTTLSSQDKKQEAVRAEDINIGDIGENEIPVGDRVEKIIEDLKPPEENKIEGTVNPFPAKNFFRPVELVCSYVGTLSSLSLLSCESYNIN